MFKLAGIQLPVWQVGVILLFLVLYILISFTPWGRRLWRDKDHRYFLPFWTSVAVLHWVSVVLVIFFTTGSGYQIGAIGLKVSNLFLLLATLLFFIGVSVYIFVRL